MTKLGLFLIACCALPICGQVNPGAGKWKTWVIRGAADYRVARPEAAGITQELNELKSWTAQRNAANARRIAFWDAGPPAYRWIQIAAGEVTAHNVGGPPATRALALVAAAINDATVAAWDSKYAYMRQRPSEVDSSIVAAVRVPQSPSFPSDYAAVAEAAASVLTYLFPDRGDAFASMAREAAESRLLAGVEFPSDSRAGVELGRRIGAAAVAYGSADGSDAVFSGSYPPAPGKWSGSSPAQPLAGSWKPWALGTASSVRPPAPPAFDSPEMTAQVKELHDLQRTTAMVRTAWVWQASFTNPWLDTITQKILEYHLDQDPPAAAQVYAEALLAQHDATLACWDTKYSYLEMRPVMFDPKITTLFATPPHPGFPSGHACAAGAFAFVLGKLFPTEAQSFDAKASEAGLSTFYAGIHFRNDVDAGLALGRAAAAVVVSQVP